MNDLTDRPGLVETDDFLLLGSIPTILMIEQVETRLAARAGIEIAEGLKGEMA